MRFRASTIRSLSTIDMVSSVQVMYVRMVIDNEIPHGRQ